MSNYNPNTSDNQQEMLVEVDEQDNIIGPVSRQECHNQTRKPWHRSTHIYLFNDKGELYLTQRSMKKDTAPGEWTVSAGGHVTFVSTPEETAEKEITEELGISVDLELIDKLTIDYGSEREVLSIFSGITNQVPKINQEEVEQIKAFPFDQIVNDFSNGKFDLSGGSRDTFKHIIQTNTLKDYRDKYLNHKT